MYNATHPARIRCTLTMDLQSKVTFIFFSVLTSQKAMQYNKCM